MNNNDRGRVIAIILLIALFGGGSVWTFIWLDQTPHIDMVSDNIGSTLGGHQFVITGEHFMQLGPTTVLVGDAKATDVQVKGSNTIVAKAPAGQDGSTSITVINPNNKRTVLSDAYVYSTLKPEITSVTPDVLPGGGGVLVTIKGVGFTASPVEVFFQATAIPARIIDNNTITFIAPPAPGELPTNANLEVITKDGKWSSDEYGLNYR